MKAPACKVTDSNPRLEIVYQNIVNGPELKIDCRTGLGEKFEKRNNWIKVPVSRQKIDLSHDDLEYTNRNQVRKIISMANRISSAPEK